MTIKSTKDRNITVYLGSFRWEPSAEARALDLFARTACLDDSKYGPVPEFVVEQRTPAIRLALEDHFGFLELLWDNLVHETAGSRFRIQSKVRFWNVWLGMPTLTAADELLKTKKDEVEVTVFTGRKKLFGDEVAAKFFAPLGRHGITEQDEERLEAAFQVAVEKIRGAAQSVKR